MNTHLTRRQFLVGAGAGLSAALLAACQPQVLEVTKVVEKQVTQVIKETVMVAGTPQVVEKVVTATPPPPTPKPVDKGPLTILWTEQLPLIKYFEAYSAERWVPGKEGVKVNITIVPQTELPQKLLSGIAAGSPPDIFRSQNAENFSQMALGGVILPLDELIARDKFPLDQFLQNSLAAGKLKGKQYCIPCFSHPSSCYLFYNKTVLDKAGIKLHEKKEQFVKSGYKLGSVDWKWDELVEIMRKTTDPAQKVFGGCIRADYWGIIEGFRTMGGDLLSTDGTKSYITDEPARRFLTMFHTLVTKDKAIPQPTDVPSFLAPFAAGKIIVANEGGYRESTLRNTVKDFEFDIFMQPYEGAVPPGTLAAGFTAITGATKHMDLAWSWVKGLLTTEEGVKRTKEAQITPFPTREALLHPDSIGVSPYYEFYVRQWMTNPPLPVPLPANGRQTEVNDLMNKVFQPAWLGTATLEATIENAHKQLQAILDKPAV
jgi:multiple sugar transport system substrate-binding protein